MPPERPDVVSFTIRRGDAVLHGTDTGEGPHTLVVQHGLGADAAQVAALMPRPQRFRRITLECRAHGGSAPGTLRPFSIALFADDVLAACDARGVQCFVAAGLSMGAALALHLAVARPDRVRGIVLGRPAWSFEAAPDNLRMHAEVADLLRRFGPAGAKLRFASSPDGRRLAREAPESFASLLTICDRADPALTAELLWSVAMDGPGVTAQQATGLGMPALMIAHDRDPVHPLRHARALAAAIPGAALTVIPPKADRAAHREGFAAALAAFVSGLPHAR